MENKKPSWFRRLWRWLFDPVQEQEEAPQPPAPLPPKSQTPSPWQAQGRLYQAMERRQPLVAGRSNGMLRVYAYCGVVFPKADIVYHYLNVDPTIQVGDHVLVPVHIHGVTKEADGIVVSTGEYLAQCVPYPVKDTSYIIRKL